MATVLEKSIVYCQKKWAAEFHTLLMIKKDCASGDIVVVVKSIKVLTCIILKG